MSGSNSSLPAVPANKFSAQGNADAPLTLTVHSLPEPGAAGDAQRRLVGRRKMLVILALCAAPVIASYFMYYVVRPEGRRNYGELITPSKALPDLVATGMDGKTMRLPDLRGQWLLVSVAGAECDAACEKHLYLQRQLRESLGRDKDRLDRIWLVIGNAPPRPELVPAFKDAYALRVDGAALAQWLAPAAGYKLTDHLYVVDPMGQWMLRFPAHVDGVKAKRDLERLMRASAGWDTAGRTAAALAPARASSSGAMPMAGTR